MNKKTKQEVNYSKGMRKSHCGPLSSVDRGYCVHYVSGGKCELVIGKIDKSYWCKLFKKAK